MEVFGTPPALQEEKVFQKICSTMFEVSEDALIAIKEDQTILRFNRGAEKIFNYEASEVVGKPLDILLPSEFIESHRRDIQQFGEGTETARYMGHRREVMGKRKNGDVFPAEATISKILVGKSMVFFASLRDISSRKEIENRLKDKELFLRNILDSLYSEVVVLNAEGVITAVNGAWEDFAKNNGAEKNVRIGVGLNYLEACKHPSMKDGEFALAAFDGIKDVLDGLRTLFTMEYPCHTPGERRWFFMRVVPLTDGSGGVVISHQDITVRKIADDIVRLNEEKFRAMIEHISDGILIIDRTANVKYASPAISKLLGFSNQEFLQNNAFEYLHPDDLDGGLEQFQRLLENQGGYEIRQFRIRDDNGNWRWVQGTGTNLLNNPAVQGVVVNFQDITERLEMYMTLQKNEEKYRLIVENANQVFYRIEFKDDPLTGEVAFISPQAETLTGHSPEEFYNDPTLWMRLINPADLSAVIDMTNQAISEHNPKTRVYRVRNFQSGQNLWVEDKIAPLLDEFNNVIGYQGVASDITERRKAELEQKRLLTVLESSLNEIYMFDPETLLFQYINRGALLNLGYSPDEIFKLTPVDLKPEFTEDSFRQILEPLVDGEREQIVFQTLHRRSNGSLYPVEVHLQLVLQDGQGIYLAIVLDITNRMEADARIRQQVDRLQALHQIDKAITSSHDLSSILGVLMEQVVKILKVDAVRISLLGPEGDTLSCVGEYGFRHKEGVLGAQVPVDTSCAGQAIVKKIPIHISDFDGAAKGFVCMAKVKEEGFVDYYGMPLIVKGRAIGILDVLNRDRLKADSGWLDFLEILSKQAAIAVDHVRLFEGMRQSNIELERAYDATLEGWSRAMDLRDTETEGHTKRVTELTLLLAQEMGLSESALRYVRWGALLHDMGKMGIPDSLLLKPGKLDHREWEIMRNHPKLAYDMLYPIEFLRPALDIPLNHHEKWDGSGYPLGLKGEQIPLPARIFAVADVWDALRFDRPYRKGWAEEKVYKYILEQSGAHFDPKVVKVFMKIMRNVT